ncbi:hypothetical protein A1O7_07736 [Cladophialophora yegresii CBS 114405]|uniref:Choline transporter n=1 Tax=Cladophialophora yegresii CBS 114405 TaxID=1182544 RepID=W9WFU3_9EURO|nr:uncharacterized protein A1O7_07736 [Cladophialophora yegresii CBS 114405]EXJ57389.1 hypothetical protein A1O7_07736 [Cladophialophora yegresii CBS 114405]
MDKGKSTVAPADRSSMDVTGLSADEIQLRLQGHVGELPRQFGTLATISLAFTITNSWIGISAVFVTPLFAGAGPAIFWGILVAAVACSFINAGLAELASAFPSSGGQYHFAFMVAPPRYRAPIAFIAGWLSVVAWWMTAASACIYCAQICVNLASFFNPEYVWTQWQVYLVYVALTCLAVAIFVLLPTLMPKTEIVFFAASLVGFLVFCIAVLAASKTKQSGRTVFVEWVNLTGWNDGIAFFLGVGSCMYVFLATDAATHIAEEMPNPSRNVPRAIGMTMVIGASTSLVWAVAFLFSTNDLDEVAGSYLPILTVFYQALHNQGGAAFLAVWLLVVYYGATISCFLTAGRLTWAFARDNGLPFSRFFAKVHPTLQVPVNASLLTMVFCILYGLIYIGSTTAFNSFISLSILGLNITYAIPQAIVLVRGRANVLPARPFNLGPLLGPFCNLFSVVWTLFYTVLFSFPVFLPVTAQNMNYVSVVLVGVSLITLALWWGGKRKTFTGPSIQIDGLEVLSAAATGSLATGPSQAGVLATSKEEASAAA